MNGKVFKLFLTLNDEQKTRLSKTQISLDENGILEDKFYAKDSQRAILISCLDSYNLAFNANIELKEGTLGENILIDINPYSLLPGQRLRIGAVELEITQNCTICKGLSLIDKKLPKLLKEDRGIFAKVVGQNGNIQVGDSVVF